MCVMKNNLCTRTENQLCEAIRAYASIIAHDIRSPISCIDLASGFCKMIIPMLEESTNGQPISKQQIGEFREWVEIIDESTAKMSAIGDNALKHINGMFNAYSGTSNNFNFTKCNIADSFTPEALKLLFVTNDPKLVHIDLKHKFSYMGNKQSMDQVIQNMLQNAFYQIKKNNKGEIFITTEARIDTNILRIRDTAGGAAPDVIKNMFNAGFTTKADGNGVGLNYCKRTIQLFGGDVIANLGTCDYIEFIISLPKIA